MPIKQLTYTRRPPRHADSHARDLARFVEISKAEQDTFDLALKGYQYNEIAKKLDVTPLTVKKRIYRVIERAAEIRGESDKQYLEVYIQQTDLALKAIADRVIQGDLQAIDRWIKLLQLRATFTGHIKREELVNPPRITIVNMPTPGPSAQPQQNDNIIEGRLSASSES